MRRNTILSLFLGLLLVAGDAVPGAWRGKEPDLATIGREAREVSTAFFFPIDA